MLSNFKGFIAKGYTYSSAVSEPDKEGSEITPLNENKYNAVRI